MIKQIKVNNLLLTVLEVYPYMYQNNKEVIRIKVSETDHGYLDIERLKTNVDPIEYYEDDVLKNVYEGYSEDYKSTFYDGIWSIELNRKSEEQRQIEELRQEVAALTEKVEGFDK